ncbi:MAG: sigma-70 family RNA polymerase sigma factor [Lachnospiraceae bacterium]|nr:sigma-70 family RNA polymerase sigma factor [Lachnospiraceae bacterium]
MTDPILALFQLHSEDAIAEAKRRYGSGLRAFAGRILGSYEDAEEVENDVYLDAWKAIPPAEPENLKSFLFMLCRRRALDRLDEKLAGKRGGGEVESVLEELEDSLPGQDGRDWAEALSLKEAFESFLEDLAERERKVFLQRYLYFYSVSEIAGINGLKENHVRVLLYRLRKQLKEKLIREDLWNE